MALPNLLVPSGRVVGAKDISHGGLLHRTFVSDDHRALPIPHHRWSRLGPFSPEFFLQARKISQT